MGETSLNPVLAIRRVSFSILKRIVMGETNLSPRPRFWRAPFQYPQADRDG